MKILTNKYWLVWLRYLALLLILLALVANIDLLGFTWASGDEIVDNILTDANLTINEYKEGVTDPLSFDDYQALEGLMPNPYDVEELLDLRIHYDFELPEGHNYHNGDYFGFDLPDQFQVFLPDGPLEGDLSDGEKVYGTYKLEYKEGSTENGKVTLTFNENIRSGELGLQTLGWVSFNTKIIKANITSLEEIITFEDISEEASITLRFEPKDQENEVSKSGSGNRLYNTENIDWEIEFNRELKTIVNPVLKDPLDPNLSLVPDSINIYKLVIYLDGTIQSPATLVYGDDGAGFVNLLSDDNLGFVLEQTDDNGSDIDFQIRFINSTTPEDPASLIEAYRLTFNTVITDGDAETPSPSYSNTATLTGTVGGEDYSQHGTATVSVDRGAPLEKEGAGVDYEGSQTAGWEVRVNYNKKSFGTDQLLVTDTFESGNHQLDENSLEVFRVEINDVTGEILNQVLLTKDTDYTLAPKDGSYQNGYILTILGETADAYKITYDTIPIERIEVNTSFTNSVAFDGKTATAGQNVNQTILVKSNSNPDYDQKTLDWTITINSDQSPMEAVYLVDDFTNMGLTIEEGTFSVTGEEITADQANYAYYINEDNSGFRVEFYPATTFSKQITITYTTYFDYQALTIKDNNFSNEANLTWTVDEIGKSLGPITSTYNPNTFTADNGFKGGVYNAADKEITWTIGVNYNLQTITNGAVSDNIVGNQTLIADSVLIYAATLPAGGGEPQKSGDPIDYVASDFSLNFGEGNSSFEITFPNSINSAYIIEYKTSLDDIFVDASYSNTATLNGTIGGSTVEFTYGPASITVPKGNTYVDKSFAYNQGSRIISWSVEINGGQSTISDVVVEDELSPEGLHVFLEDSLRLYATSVNATTGALSKTGEPLVEGTDYQLLTEGIEGKSFRLTLIGDYSTIDQAYILEYNTFVLANNNDDPIKNKVTLAATGLDVGIRENVKTVTVSITTGAGGAYNLINPATLIVEKQSFSDDAEDEGTLLSGAEFELYYKSGEEITMISSGITGEDGKLQFSNLAGGLYILKEITPPEGYLYAVEDTEIEISTDSVDQNNELTVSIRNDKILQAVRLIKTDSVTDEPIEGATFALIRISDQQTFYFTTNAEGEIYLNNLTPGSYRFEEFSPAPGYVSNREEIEFEIVEDQIIIEVVEFINTYGKGISLQKSGVLNSGTGDGVYRAGDTITYTYLVRNTGIVDLTDVSVIELSDDFTGTGVLPVPQYVPGSSTMGSVVGTLKPNEAATYTATYILNQDDINNGSVVNKATASGTPPAGEPVTIDDTDTQELNANPLIQILKEGSYSDTNGDSVVNAGDQISYTYLVTNTGNVVLTGVTVSEAETDFSGTYVNLTTPEFQSSTLGSPVGKLQPGESATYNAIYTLTQDDIDAGEVDNKASVAAKLGETDLDPVSSETRVDLTPNASISLTKSADKTELIEGETITYTFTVTNNGNVTLDNVMLADPLAGLSAFFDCKIDGSDAPESVTLQPNQSLTCQATYVVTQDDIDAGNIVNTASASAEDPDGSAVSDSAAVTVEAQQEKDLSITKTASVESFSQTGEVISYTIVITNNGNVTLTNVAVLDSLIGLSQTIVSLAPGASQEFTGTYTITQADLDRGFLTNTASATAGGQEPGGSDLIDSDTVTIDAVQTKAINLVKRAVPASYSSLDQVITYYFEVENIGNVTLRNVRIDDALLGISGVAVSPSVLEPGQKGVLTFPYAVTQANLDNGSIVNTATARGTTPDSSAIQSQGIATATARNISAAVSIEKTADVTSFSAVGNQISYSFIVRNTGDVTLYEVTLDDAKLGISGLEVAASLAPGQSETISAPTYTVTQADVDEGKILNVAVVSAKDPDQNEIGGLDSVTVNGPERVPSIALDKAADRQTYSSTGQVINYSFTVVNTGTVTLRDVKIDDALLDITDLPITPSTLAPNQSGTATASYTVTASDIGSGKVIYNTARVTGTPAVGDDVTAEDDETVNYLQPTVPVTPNPEITLKKFVSVDLGNNWLDAETAASGPVTITGSEVLFRFVITNSGNVPLTELTLSDSVYDLSAVILPAELAAGATYIHNLSSIASFTGLHFNTATASGRHNNNTYNDTDVAYYNSIITVTPTVPAQPSQPSQPSPQTPTQPAPSTPSPEQQQPASSQPPANQSPPVAPTQPPAVDDSSREPGPEESAQRRTRTVTETTPQDQAREGMVEVPEGSVARIGDFPSNGTATIDEVGNWVYTPRPGFSGEDRFTIIVRNADGTEEEVTLIINVEEPGLQPEGDGQDSNAPISTPRTAGAALASLYSLWLMLIASFALRRGVGRKDHLAAKLRG